jgi:hypothetical protein
VRLCKFAFGLLIVVFTARSSTRSAHIQNRIEIKAVHLRVYVEMLMTASMSAKSQTVYFKYCHEREMNNWDPQAFTTAKSNKYRNFVQSFCRSFCTASGEIMATNQMFLIFKPVPLKQDCFKNLREESGFL